MKCKTILAFGMILLFGGIVSADSLITSETAVDSTSLTITLSGKVTLEMKKIPAGSFMMGSPENELGRATNEVQHKVTITKDYWLGMYEVTQAQWQAVMGGDNPSEFKKGEDYAVECVAWVAALAFCEMLNNDSSIQKPEGYQFSLPTEAQWEYACRAGTTTALNSGKNLTAEKSECPNLDEVGWYGRNSGDSTHPVGQKKPNAWGLYDMHGNVWEWCQDWYGSYHGDVTDPVGPASGKFRVLRGGCWEDYRPRFFRSAFRSNGQPGRLRRGGNRIGFRLALVPVQE